jgi:putative addiction module component (TIGR02574 family)
LRVGARLCVHREIIDLRIDRLLRCKALVNDGERRAPLSLRIGDSAARRALQLPEEERAELALRLLDSVGEPAEAVECAWIEEAKRRLAEIQRGEVGTAPWAEARNRIFAR